MLCVAHIILGISIHKSLRLYVQGIYRNEIRLKMSSNTSEGSGTHDVEGQTSQTKRRKRSNVWEHFEQILVEADGDLKAICRYCRLKLSTKSGTSSLRGHIANSCPAIESVTRKRFLATMNKQPPEGNFVFDPQICHEEMIKYIIHAEIPFLKFEDPYLQPWIDTMQPTFKVKGHQTIGDECLKMFENMKKELQTELQNLDSRVCLTSDIWKSSQNLEYMAVTAHYVDPEFKLKKKTIWFKELEYPHNGFAIKEEIVRCLTDWGIRDKLFTLTLDNASNSTSACDELITNHKHELLFEGEHLHVKCFTHILNILVQDGMRVIHTAIDKIRELLKHMNSSISRLQEFNSLAIGRYSTSKSGIYLDIPNRWNSTLKMLREALKYKTVLYSYAFRYSEDSPSEEEWAKVDAICEFLKGFEEFTLDVSDNRKPTAHMFLPWVLYVRYALKDSAYCQSTDLLKELAASMHSKFEKYWDPDEGKTCNKSNPQRKKKEIAFNPVLAIATILDPRKKVDYLEFFYEKVCSNANQSYMHVNCALEWMRKYFTAYEQRCGRTSSEQRCGRTSSADMIPVLGNRTLEAEFAQYKAHRRVARAPKYEIDSYLKEEIEEENEDLDILAWWKSRADKYPVLSVMARDFLAIPLSTVSSESALSCGGRILEDHRSSLTPEMLEALVCAKDWLFKTKDLHSDGQDVEPQLPKETVT
ncbi:hypothetical protein U9M48_033808 [Paspalum notatum var. saurae]|uniref:BED-type domain-containing protein n=1 Tax=Paspalum notatum var. saurae TaxID=547442 RepID=A0AAQ3X740_PASNO